MRQWCLKVVIDSSYDVVDDKVFERANKYWQFIQGGYVSNIPLSEPKTKKSFKNIKK